MTQRFAIVSLRLLALFTGGAIAQEMPWYAKISQFHFPHLFAEDLSNSTFDSQLLNTTMNYVLVDFYAPWCPHCQHFAPDYERLAATIGKFDQQQGSLRKSSSRKLVAGEKGGPSAQPTVLAATVDCVKDAGLCNAWGIQSFPTLLWGKREDWVSKRVAKLQNIEVWPRTAEMVAQWIDNNTHIHLDPSQVSKAEIVQLLHHQQVKSHSDKAKRVTPETVDMWDVQLAAAYLVHNSLASHPFEEGQEAGPKAAMLNFIDLLAKRFPDTTAHVPEHLKQGGCRPSLQSLSQLLRRNWTGLGSEVSSPQGVKYIAINPVFVEANWQLCDTDWDDYGKGWGQCRGTWPGKRGFTCGLWSMFHTLAARTDDKNAMADLQVVRDTLWYFFDCQDCREHFFQIPLTKDDVSSRREAQLWWWNAHNVVNRRVKKLEEQYQDGDPEFPKMQWPTPSECHDCRKKPTGTLNATVLLSAAKSANATQVRPGDVAIENPKIADAVHAEGWDLDAVGAFLDRYYLAHA